MGRRTLVAIADGSHFDCRYAHWGVDADPFAQSHPLGVDWSPSELLDRLDAEFEQLLVCDGQLRRYCVCWLDPTLTDPDDIVLVRTDTPEGFREWWVENKSDYLGHDTNEATTRTNLVDALNRRPEPVFWPDDTSFLFDDG